MDAISSHIINLITTVPESLHLLLFFGFSFAEGLPIVGTFLPGGSIAILAGSLVEQKIELLLPIILIISSASFLGDITGFLIARKYKHSKWVEAVMKNQKTQKSLDLLDRHMALIVIFGKLIPIVRSAPSVLFAMRGVRFSKYIICSFVGSVVWAILGVYAGKVLTNYLGKNFILLIVGVIAVSFVLVIFKFIFTSKSSRGV